MRPAVTFQSDPASVCGAAQWVKLSLSWSKFKFTDFHIMLLYIKGKGKVHPRTGHEGPQGEQMYSSTLSSTSALDGVGGQRHVPAALPPGKDTRYPLYRRLGGSQGRSGGVRKFSPPPRFDPRTVQSVASRYTATDWTVRGSNPGGGELHNIN